MKKKRKFLKFKKPAFIKGHGHSTRVSKILAEAAEKISDKNYTIGDFIKNLSERSFGFAILIFALPNSIPVPSVPGFSAITGLPIAFIALQMLFGGKQLWLPKFLLKKQLSGKAMIYTLQKASKIMEKTEKFIYPRAEFLTKDIAEKFLGLVIMILAGILALPILFGNFLPAFSICLLAVAVIERDGLLAIAGVICGVVAAAVVGSIVFGLGYLFTHSIF